jgi:hypothetical protein
LLRTQLVKNIVDPSLHSDITNANQTLLNTVRVGLLAVKDDFRGRLCVPGAKMVPPVTTSMTTKLAVLDERAYPRPKRPAAEEPGTKHLQNMSNEEVMQMAVSKRRAAAGAISTYRKVAAAANDREPDDDTNEAVATDESTEDLESSQSQDDVAYGQLRCGLDFAITAESGDESFSDED